MGTICPEVQINLNATKLLKILNTVQVSGLAKVLAVSRFWKIVSNRRKLGFFFLVFNVFEKIDNSVATCECFPYNVEYFIIEYVEYMSP